MIPAKILEQMKHYNPTINPNYNAIIAQYLRLRSMEDLKVEISDELAMHYAERLCEELRFAVIISMFDVFTVFFITLDALGKHNIQTSENVDNLAVATFNIAKEIINERTGKVADNMAERIHLENCTNCRAAFRSRMN